MLCVRECPVWCLHLGSHQEVDPSGPAGRRPRLVNVLDSFEVDYGLCMYCGICVEVCPFDALAWVATPTPPAPSAGALLHGRDRLEPLWPGPAPAPGQPGQG
jgi:NADH-quinone oxidoreductase subunit I